MSEEIETTVKTADGITVSLSSWDNGAWISVVQRHFDFHTAFTREEAQALMNGLQAILAKEDAIVTEYVCPPIPVRDMDWQATRKDYDEGDPIGRGATKQDAINNLLEMEGK